MADTAEQSPIEIEVREDEGEEEKSFEELGLDPRLIRALIKKGVEKPTPIQRAAIPLILVSFDLLICQFVIPLFFFVFSSIRFCLIC